MERFGPATHKEYRPAPSAGSSSVASDDLHPAQKYGTDLRYLDKDERSTAERADTGNKAKERNVTHYLAAAKAAEKYKQNALIDEPGIRGKTPRGQATIKGTTVPNLGDRIGTGGSTNYARKPDRMAGKFVGFSG